MQQHAMEAGNDWMEGSENKLQWNSATPMEPNLIWQPGKEHPRNRFINSPLLAK